MSDIFDLLEDYIDKSVHALRKHRWCGDIGPCTHDGVDTDYGTWPEVSEALAAYQVFKRSLKKDYKGKVVLQVDGLK